MSGVSSSTSSTSQGTLGDVPPVTFPGIASGIDYNAIIEKYTAATLAAEQPYQTQLNKLNLANAETLKLQSLFGKVQDSLTALSDVGTFQSYTATPTAAGVANATQISGQNAVPGTYSIVAQTLATSTVIRSDTAAGAQLTPAAYAGTPLAQIGASVTPSNGTLSTGLPASNGSLTINGVKINYDVNTDSLQAIVNRINSAGAGVTATYNAGTDEVTLTATTAAGLALGSAGDTGNLASVLHVDTAQLNGSGAGQNVTSSAAIVGINPNATLQGTGNAGFATQVSSGTFTINGVQITIDASTESVANILDKINASGAGVTASFDAGSDRIVLGSSVPGPRNIVLGSSSDTSNFLVAGGLTPAYGAFGADPSLNASTTIGTQASVTYLDSTGSARTAYNSTNDFTGLIPGIDLQITSSTATPYGVTVATDPKAAESAIGTFVTAYNTAIDELNSATAPPVITTSRDQTTGQNQSTQATTGGPLYNDFEVSSLRDQLVQIVSSFIPTGSSAYNSLQSIGLKLDTSSVSSGTVDASDASDSASNSSTSTQGLTATSGRLTALDTTAFEAALAANPSAVQALFTSAGSGLVSTLGTQLTTATGLPTYTTSGIVGSLPSQSLLGTVEDGNQLTIDALQQQITLINTEATMQADALRAEFSNSEAQIAQLQALQQQISAIGN